LDEVDKGVQETLSDALEAITQRLDALSTRLDALDEGVGGRISSVTERLGALDGALAHRPDGDSLAGLIRQANEESETRFAAQLDEAMATFAEIIMGGAPAPLPPTPPPLPRPPHGRRPVSGIPTHKPKASGSRSRNERMQCGASTRQSGPPSS
jgi:hypothetical protein